MSDTGGKNVSKTETIASLPGFIMVFEEPISYSLGSNIRTRKAKRCLVRVLIGLIPPKGLPRLQTCPRQRWGMCGVRVIFPYRVNAYDGWRTRFTISPTMD